MTDDLLKRLLQPPFGTETSERNLMAEAAVRILELEAASARARDDALVEAAREVTKALAMQDAGYHVQLATLMQAIQALRTQPPPSVEPVTVQEAARVLLGDDYNSPMLEMLDKYNNDYDVGQDVLKALTQLKEPKP